MDKRMSPITRSVAPMRQFHRVLANTLVANVTTSFLWFALTFWVYLETKSVLATAIVGGLYMLLVALLGIPFGVLVDRHKKKRVMVASSLVTTAAYLIAGFLYLVVDKRILLDWTGPMFWLFSGVILIGGVVENLRNIALSTTVTLLVPDEQRPQANGLVGAVQGIAFTLTSVFSGLAIGLLGMGWTLGIAITLTVLALLHLFTVAIPEEGVFHDPELGTKKIDLAGSIAAVRAVPGLMALIFFTCFNNLVGGVFMALMDPYGLTLFPVEAWGIVLGVTGTGFIVGGAIVAKRGLGENPVRTLLLVNVGVALLGMLFTIREWQWLYAVGIFLFMAMMPAAEAAEQTIIQRVVPLHRQGRVFGLAQSVESASTPVSSFLIGPLAQFWLIPYMNSDSGRATWGWLLGSGEARGIAAVFVMASLVMLVVVLLAFRTKAYALLSRFYSDSAPPAEPVGA
ncbi:DHA3 family multidrug efflux protein-like MFS transporter [Enemella evansiae]|nr:DHA3 family multidrug efflux protein-like MFS transporter [Enemella evansiae]